MKISLGKRRFWKIKMAIWTWNMQMMIRMMTHLRTKNYFKITIKRSKSIVLKPSKNRQCPITSKSSTEATISGSSWSGISALIGSMSLRSTRRRFYNQCKQIRFSMATRPPKMMRKCRARTATTSLISQECPKSAKIYSWSRIGV